MLTKLFSSTRAELLSLFFNNPDEKFYLEGEIARHISKDAAGIKRELDTLVGIGLLAVEKRGVQKYYFADKASSIFTEMKGLIFKTTGVQARSRRRCPGSRGSRGRSSTAPMHEVQRARTATLT
jgi:predicted transcriptional regulator